MSTQLEVVLDHNVAECGGVIRGTVRWGDNHGGAVVEAMLQYFVRGRSDPERVNAVRFGLALDEAGQAGLRLYVPERGPITYNGDLMRVSWSVIVVGGRGSLRKANRFVTTTEVTVVPRGWMSVDH
jgi:hypothetical protein